MKYLRKIFSILAILFPLLAAGQGMEITVIPTVKTDSLSLCQYKFSKYEPLQLSVSKTAKQTVFKSKTALEPGIYLLKADTNEIAEILVSDKKNQKFRITFGSDFIAFDNSEENNKYAEYLSKKADFALKLKKIEKEFSDTQKGNLPDYMKQNIISNLVSDAQKTEKEKNEYFQKLMTENENTLLASVVRCDLELPHPPQAYYQNPRLMLQYVADHTFDTYPFEDERLLNSKIASDKIKQYGSTLYQFEGNAGEPYITKLLKKLSNYSDKTYYFFFDNLERTIGSLKSPFWSENLYIIMLKDALARPNLENARSIRYKDQLGRLDKNLRGSTLPNFKIMLSNDSITDLYSVESEFLLLYFQNPDCPTCTEVRNRMAKMETLNKALASGKLKVLTVYFEEDEALWRRYLKEKANPAYMHGWDYQHEIEDKELFDLRIIPYIFFLDKDKKVLKKDLLVNEIEDFVKRYVIY